MKIDMETLQPKFYNLINKALDEGFLSHAYLIETNNNNLDIVLKYVLFLVKKIYDYSYKNHDVTISKEKLFHLLENKEFPDYIEIEPINNQIKKEQLIFIRDEFSSKSLYNTFKIYVVYDCEKMNVSSANTILKFLEEPSDDVIAIFVTSNQYNVLDTIRSRCQIINLQFEEENNINFSDEVFTFIDDIKNRKTYDLMLKYNYYNVSFKDKNSFINLLKSTLKYYEIQLNRNNGDSLNEIVAIISTLDKKLKDLKYNVNMKLWLDDLMLSLMEV